MYTTITPEMAIAIPDLKNYVGGHISRFEWCRGQPENFGSGPEPTNALTIIVTNIGGGMFTTVTLWSALAGNFGIGPYNHDMESIRKAEDRFTAIIGERPVWNLPWGRDTWYEEWRDRIDEEDDDDEDDDDED